MDAEQLQEIINVLNNKLAQVNLDHAATLAQLTVARRQIEALTEQHIAKQEERIETVTIDHVEKK